MLHALLTLFLFLGEPEAPPPEGTPPPEVTEKAVGPDGEPEPPPPPPPRRALVVPLVGEPNAPGDPYEWGLGPFDPRDPFPLALMHFTIPVESPATVPKGVLRGQGSQVVWANTFALGQDYIIDAEVETYVSGYRLGITDNWELSLEVPFTYIGAGSLDGLVDTTHDLINRPDDQRETRDRNRFKMEVDTDEGLTVFSRDANAGDVTVGTKYRFLDGGPCTPAVAAAFYIKLPSAPTRHLGREGFDFGLSLSASKRFGPVVVYGGGGAWATTDNKYEHVEYRRTAAHGWIGGEVGLIDGLVLSAHVWIRTPLLAEARGISRRQHYGVGGLRYRTRLELEGTEFDFEVWLGIIQNWSHLENTSDFGWIMGLEMEF